MKYIISIAFVFQLISTSIHAQKNGQALIDSLISELPKSKPDSNKVLLLDEISYQYYAINPDKGIEYGNLALSLASQINWKKGIAKAYNTIGINYGFGKANYPYALDFFLKSLRIFEEIRDKKSLALVINNLGFIYMSQADFDQALTYYFKAVQIATELKNKRGVARFNGNIGVVYDEQGLYKKAQEYYHKAIHTYEELNDKEGLSRNYGNIGVSYRMSGNYREALKYEKKALRLAEEMNDLKAIAMNTGNIGSIYLSLASVPENRLLNELFSGSKTAALKEAKILTKKAIGLYEELGDLNGLYKNYENLSDEESLLGNKEAALESYKKYAALKDTLFNIEKDKKLTQAAMQYEFEKKEAIIKAEQEEKDALALKELQRQKMLRNSFISGFIIVLLFAGVFFTQRNKIKKGKKLSDELLLNILPEEVAEELKAKGSADAQLIDSVTVLFTDFKDFTQLAEKLGPKELVSEINECFSAFDLIMQKHGVEKIKTIGDAYMAAGGLPTPNQTHARDVVNAALAIQEYMQHYKIEKSKAGKLFFDIRIGVHTGPVVAGIVGIKKFAYDIWGDTVNTASRMESSGEAGKVNISHATYELIQHEFNCVYRGAIEAKNKGKIEMYYVESIHLNPLTGNQG
jgi:adenylate cyclase